MTAKAGTLTAPKTIAVRGWIFALVVAIALAGAVLLLKATSASSRDTVRAPGSGVTYQTGRMAPFEVSRSATCYQCMR